MTINDNIPTMDLLNYSMTWNIQFQIIIILDIQPKLKFAQFDKVILHVINSIIDY